MHIFVWSCLFCRQYLRRWLRHTRSKKQHLQQLTAAAQLHRQLLCTSIMKAWLAAAAAGASLRQRLAAWRQRKQFAVLRAWGDVAAARQQQQQLVKQVWTGDVAVCMCGPASLLDFAACACSQNAAVPCCLLRCNSLWKRKGALMFDVGLVNSVSC